MEVEPSTTFRTPDGQLVPTVTAAQMREVDRIAVDEVGLTLLQMMESAGRCLAGNVMEMLAERGGSVVVLAGSGGNGGGGLCCARHLLNRGYAVSMLLSKDPEDLEGAAARQFRILRATGHEPTGISDAQAVVAGAHLVVDALVGYSLRGAPRGRLAELIALCNGAHSPTLSLDLPSGLDATSGEAPGAVVRPARTLTLALPKRGLLGLCGELFLGDIGIPADVYRRAGIAFKWPAGARYWVALKKG